MDLHALNTTTTTIDPALQVFTNPSHLKRTTCDLCRVRKVRCDRVKPQCGRCKRTGQICTYPSASGEVARINSELRSLQSRLRLAESELRKQNIPFPVEPVGPVPNSRVTNSAPHTSLLITEIALGDVVAPADLESWDHAMDFVTLESLLDRDMHTGSSSDPASIAEAYSDPAIWPVERLRADQRTVLENPHPDLRNGWK